MTEPHLSYDEVRAGARELTKFRKAALQTYLEKSKVAAAAEKEYRKQKAIALVKYRSEEKGVGESEILADGDVAELREQRDINNALAKSALLRIEELEREQATLRQLAGWSQEMETRG